MAPTQRPQSVLLSAQGLRKSYGGVRAVDGVTLDVREGEIVGMVGPNGSGKTTTFSLIAGSARSDEGTVLWRGVPITNWPQYRVAQAGVVRSFQLTRPFAELTIFENLEVAAGHDRERLERVWSLLQMVGLIDKLDHRAEALSYGQRKLLDIIRAVTVGGSLLLLDEPFAGVNRVMASSIVDLIARIRDERRASFLIVDHEMTTILNLCDHIYVLDTGRVMFQGTPSAVRTDPRTLEVYLGKRFAAGA